MKIEKAIMYMTVAKLQTDGEVRDSIITALDAMEEKYVYRWHDMTEEPDFYPSCDSCVLAVIYSKFSIDRKYSVVYYGKEGWSFPETNNNEKGYRVIAWKYFDGFEV